LLGSRVLALWWGIIVFTSMIIGLGVRFGVSPLGTSGHANGVPSRGINPQTLKTIHLITVWGVSSLVGDYCFYLNDHRVGGMLRGLPLGTSGHANGVPSREINPQTLKTIHIIIIVDIYLESLKILPRPKGRGLPSCHSPICY
jgi:hypothetical protein